MACYLWFAGAVVVAGLGGVLLGLTLEARFQRRMRGRGGVDH